MANPSPLCSINGQPTPQDVSASSTVAGALISAAGANYWSIACTSTDDLNTATAINATLIVNQTNKTFSFTAPSSQGTAVIFTSTVGVIGPGLDANGIQQPAFSVTFKVNVLAANTLRVLAGDEEQEQDPPFGWVAVINAAIRLIGGGAGANVTFAGDLSGTNFSQIVQRINGATVPAAGALTTGQILQVIGAAAVAYGALNLGLPASITGVLPPSNGGTGLNSLGPNGDVLTMVSGAPAWAAPTGGGGGTGASGFVTINIGTSASYSSTFQIPAGSAVVGVRVNIAIAYVSGTTATIEVGVTGIPTLILASGIINPTNVTSTDIPLIPVTVGTTAAVLVTLGGAPSAGSGKVIVFYGTPQS